jgi:hypothetical protein
LTKQIIERLSAVQLFAESHDQGFANKELEGLWTWLELVILKDEHAEVPLQQDDVELVWRSHQNNPLSADWSWVDTTLTCNRSE